MSITGWALERFHEPMEDYICAICREVCRKACTLNCGHSFCESCITLSSVSGDQGKRCCLCRTPCTQLVPDFAKRMYINGVTIDCVYKDNGCTFQTSVSRIPEHEISCTFRPLPCNSCKDPIPACKMEMHWKESCRFRSVPCPDCSLPIIFSEIKFHKDTD